MNSRFYTLTLLLLSALLPGTLFAQDRQGATNTQALPPDSLKHADSRIPLLAVHRYHEDSTFSILFNASNVFYTSRDSRINNFLVKYGYIPQQQIPIGINLELAAVPYNSRMTYALSASTIVSRQDIISSYFKAAAYREFFERKHYWISAGLALGTHGSRVLLNGKIPPNLDSIANVYGKELVLRRTGYVAEPAIRFFWYPLQKSRFQLGLFGITAYDFALNKGWKLGYYKQSGQFSTFKGIGKTNDVLSHKEFGWALSDGLSFCFKFD